MQTREERSASACHPVCTLCLLFDVSLQLAGLVAASVPWSQEAQYLEHDLIGPVRCVDGPLGMIGGGAGVSATSVPYLRPELNIRFHMMSAARLQ